MKILHLIYDHMKNPWVGGGGAVRVYEIYKRISGRHNVTVVCGKYPGARDYKEGNIDFRFVGTSRNNYLFSTFCYAARAAGFLRTSGNLYDVVVEDFAPWNPVFSSFFTDRPAVLHVNHREGPNILKRWFVAGLPFYMVEMIYPRLFRYVNALSEETRRKIKVPSAVIVPAGIGSEIMRNDTGNEEDGSILYVGRLHIKNKGLDTLFSAMKKAGGRLVLAGRGPDEKKLKEMAKDLGIKDIEFAGFVTEGKKLIMLKQSCFFVLPSRFEGWGIVVLEAAACGKPVIVSDIPELRYAVDGGFGLSFKTGNAEDLAEKINLLSSNTSLRRELGQKAREYAKNFTWDRIAEEYEKYLIKIGSLRDPVDKE